MAKVTDAAPEVVADVAEEVAEAAEHVAEVSRGMDPRDFRLLLTGFSVGSIGGFVLGGWLAVRRLDTKYRELAESEIDEMREHFRRRLIAREDKPDLATEASKIAEREGYSTPQTPIQEERDEVSPPEGDEEEVVVEEVEVEVETETPETEVNLFEETSKEASEGWDYEEEHRLRRPDRPYVIHVDERHEKDGYTEISLTYYAADDVLCDEHDTPVDDKEKIVGEGNLEKFGHGSHDKEIVYVRNDVMQIDVEIVKNDGSYAEVVHGFAHSDEPHHHRGRPRFDDEPGSP